MQNAINAVLETNQLGTSNEGDVVRVSTKKALEDIGHDLVTVTIPLKFAKADKVAPQVKFILSARGTSTFDQRTNSVTARDTEREIANVRRFIEKIDYADKQVLIEAKIVEATTNYFQGLGMQWGTTAQGSTYWIGGPQSVGSLDSNRTAMVNEPVIGPNSGIRFSFTPSGALGIDAQLTAAEQNGDLTILSRPSIVATNNQQATMRSGAKFYVRTAQTGNTVNVSGGGGGSSSGSSSSSSSTSTSSSSTGGTGSTGSGGSSGSTGIQEIDSGLTLAVTPQITADNKINLTVSVTESQPDFSNAVDGIPSIVENNATTTVLLENGAITVIGGLFQKSASKQRNGVPFLSNIPILGYLFGSRQVKDSKKELIIFLKPTLVAEGEKPANQIESEKRSKELSDIIDPPKS
jgi:type IV pilus assembly protein PilQ